MKRVLTVGLEIEPETYGDMVLDIGGLGRLEVVQKSAPALYDYDVIIINPKSFSHIVFGEPTEASGRPNELRDLKAMSSSFDFDNVVDWDDRRRELAVAAESGATIVWCLSSSCRQNFFGYRTTYSGFLNPALARAVEGAGVVVKSGRRLIAHDSVFPSLFDVVRTTGWSLALKHGFEGYRSVADTPERYSLAGRVEVGLNGWLVTPPTSPDGVMALLRDALKLPRSKSPGSRYHGIFLCHTGVDKPFVRHLRKILLERGVKSVWVDEAEIQIGDSLTSKIQQAINSNAYLGVVLTPASVQAPWVQRELAMALTREIDEQKTVVLPLLAEDCQVPLILRDKFYADLRVPERFGEEIARILRRLET